MTLSKTSSISPSTSSRANLCSGSRRGSRVPRRRFTTMCYPELKLCFEDALNFIKSGLQSKTSKASYRTAASAAARPFHGGAAPDSSGQHSRTRHPGTGLGHYQAQRLDHRQEVPACALSHDRLQRHGVGHPRRICRVHSPGSPGCPDPRRLPRGRPVPRRREPTEADGRRPVFRHARGRLFGG